MKLIHRFINRISIWYNERITRTYITLTIKAVVEITESRCGQKLTREEKDTLIERWLLWISEKDERITELFEKPERTINMFISEVV